MMCHALPIDRIPVEQRLLDWIVGQGICILAVRIARCDAAYTLTERIQITMKYFAGLSGVVHATMQSLGQSKFVIDSFRQNCATIEAAVELIENDRNRFVKFFTEKNRLCVKLSRQKASVCIWIVISLKYLCAYGGFLFYVFTNNPG